MTQQRRLITARWQVIAIAAMASVASVAGLTVPHRALAATAADVARLDAPDRQQRLEQGARAEGHVVLYTSLVVQQAAEPIQAAFERKYPFVKLEFFRANSAHLVQRVLAENRAGANRSDVVIAGAGPALARTGFVQPFASPVLAAYPKDHIGPDGSYAATRFSYQGIGYNTRLVKPEEAPQTYQDLLDPRWRGKMVWSNSQETGAPFFITQIRQIMGEDKARDYLTALSRQNIATQSASIRSVLDQVIAGEYAMNLMAFNHHTVISARKGAPSGWIKMEPAPVELDALGLVKDAPHPNAAKLLLDFLLSEEGQKVFQKFDYLPTLPSVPPTVAGLRPNEGSFKADFLNPEFINRGVTEWQKIAQDLFR
jgi:iron(III) transport system substrate-binding protein